MQRRLCLLTSCCGVPVSNPFWELGITSLYLYHQGKNALGSTSATRGIWPLLTSPSPSSSQRPHWIITVPTPISPLPPVLLPCLFLKLQAPVTLLKCGPAPVLPRTRCGSSPDCWRHMWGHRKRSQAWAPSMETWIHLVLKVPQVTAKPWLNPQEDLPALPSASSLASFPWPSPTLTVHPLFGLSAHQECFHLCLEFSSQVLPDWLCLLEIFTQMSAKRGL